MKVALLGLGAMGAQFLLRLLDRGIDVTGWNRTRERAERAGLPAGQLASSVGEATRGAEVVITMLADGDAVLDVLSAADFAPGALVIDMSTTGPGAAREIANTLAGKGTRFVEAPVSGSVGAARQGTLTIIAGGADEDVRAAEPVLRELSGKIVHTGPVGTASTLKLCVNALLHTFNAALGEVLGAAERAGIGRRETYDLIGSSAIAAPFIEYKRAAFLADGNPPVAFSVDLVRKDLALFLDTLADPVQDAPTVHRAADVVERAQEAGFGDQDMSAIARLFRPS